LLDGMMMRDHLDDIVRQFPLFRQRPPGLAMGESHGDSFRLVQRNLLSEGTFHRRQRFGSPKASQASVTALVSRVNKESTRTAVARLSVLSSVRPLFSRSQAWSFEGFEAVSDWAAVGGLLSEVDAAACFVTEAVTGNEKQIASSKV
jgi:hypothetical protein